MNPFALVATLALTIQQSPVDPYNLPIGSNGSWMVAPGRITRLATLQAVTPDEIATAAKGKRFLFLGEQHATAPHQMLQAAIVDALARQNRRVVVCLEMYQRPKQEFLDAYTQGVLSEEDFLEKSDWKGQWGFDFAFYRPVFDVARRRRLTLLGMNIPRDWVRTVGRGGISALGEAERAQLPKDIDLANASHRQVFEALVGGHPGMSRATLDNMYAAQVLWDEGMADTIARHVAATRPSGNTIYVVIAGIGHTMYGQGINYRLSKRGLGDGVSVAMLESDKPVLVSQGIADFVFVSPRPRSSGS